MTETVVPRKVAVKKAAPAVATRPVRVHKARAGVVGGLAAVRKGPPLARERTAFLMDVVGGAELARILGVSRSQPTRWRQGAEQPGPEAARELVDLDHVVARALMLWTARVAVDWLTSANGYLDGARPVDVLKVRGSAEVVAALDAAEAGALG